MHLLPFWVSHTFLILTPQKVSIHDIVLSDTSSWPPVWSVHSSVYNGGLTLGERNINCKRIDICLNISSIFIYLYAYHRESNTYSQLDKYKDSKRSRKTWWMNFLYDLLQCQLRRKTFFHCFFLPKGKNIFLRTYRHQNAMHIYWPQTKLLS